MIHEHLRRDFIPNMVKMDSKEAIRVVRNNEMNVDDALRLNGCYLTTEDIRWLNTSGAKYTIMPCPQMGTMAVIKLRFK